MEKKEHGGKAKKKSQCTYFPLYIEFCFTRWGLHVVPLPIHAHIHPHSAHRPWKRRETPESDMSHRQSEQSPPLERDRYSNRKMKDIPPKRGTF